MLTGPIPFGKHCLDPEMFKGYSCCSQYFDDPLSDYLLNSTIVALVAYLIGVKVSLAPCLNILNYYFDTKRT